MKTMTVFVLADRDDVLRYTICRRHIIGLGHMDDGTGRLMVRGLEDYLTITRDSVKEFVGWASA